MKPDYSKYLTPERLAIEEKLWTEAGRHKLYAEAVCRLPAHRPMQQQQGETSREPIPIPRSKVVLELGCGTGIVAQLLPESYDYLGVDANPDCIRLARAKNSATRLFHQSDLRDFSAVRNFDVVCAFAFFKHFEPAEWEKLFVKALGLAPYAAFSMAVVPTGESVENGIDFPHYLVNEEAMTAALKKAKRRILFVLESESDEPIFGVGPIPAPPKQQPAQRQFPQS